MSTLGKVTGAVGVGDRFYSHPALNFSEKHLVYLTLYGELPNRLRTE
jgi:hypothetical protein